MLSKGSTILFQGDSITDCDRDFADISSLGVGYASKVKDYLDTFYRGRQIKVVNKGISGNRVVDLNARWDEDCIALKPDYLSILIGVNDTWRRYDSNDHTTTEMYYNGYKGLLDRVKAELPNCEIILIEPFLLMTNEQFYRWYSEDLADKIQAVRRLSREYGTKYLAMDGIFAEYSTNKPPSYWSEDGVHPTDEGHGLIAKKWIEKVLDHEI